MRLSLRIVLLTAFSAVLILSAASVAAAKPGPKPPPPRSNNPHLAEQQDAAQEAAAQGAGGAIAQPGGCQTTDPEVTGSGNVVVNPSGATSFTCHGALPTGVQAPDRAVKVDLGDCDTVLTPAGRVRTICHSRP